MLPITIYLLFLSQVLLNIKSCCSPFLLPELCVSRKSSGGQWGCHGFRAPLGSKVKLSFHLALDKDFVDMKVKLKIKPDFVITFTPPTKCVHITYLFSLQQGSKGSGDASEKK